VALSEAWEARKKAIADYTAKKKKYDDLQAAWDEGIEKNYVGKYTYHAPSEERCKGNLFGSRKFHHKVEERGDDQIRVMHWNILADGLSGSGLSLMEGYKTSLKKQFASPKECLKWDYRLWLILEEIAHYDPDIITLVELDRHHSTIANAEEYGGKVEESLQYWLQGLGYDMAYEGKKTGLAYHGTGFFWKTKILKPQGEEIYRKLVGGQLFGLMLFSLKNSKVDAKLAVCALHLDSKKETEGEEIRVNQMWNALYWLSDRKYKAELEQTWYDMKVDNQKEPEKRKWEALPVDMTNYPVIITGDFNAERKLSYDENGKIVQPGAVGVPYLAGFKSLYDEVIGGDLPWTSWKKRPAGRTDKYTIDYIFGSERIKSLGVLGEVPESEVDPTPANPEGELLPNWNYGSDHISLVVDFEIVKGDPKREQTSLSDGWWILENPGKVAIAIAVVVITFLLWKCKGPGNRRRKSRTASSDGSKNS